MPGLQEKVAGLIKEYKLLIPGMRVVVGVSGGADSIALLHALKVLSRPLSLQLQVAHLNHLLRQEAGEDAAFVQQFARELGIPVTVGYARVAHLAELHKMGIEEAGRWARYRFLYHVAERTGAHRIAVAHHAGDQVETVLLNILRGAGPAGLSGMPVKSGLVIRPLLNVTREEIEEYCGAHLLGWRTDASNLTTDYQRNRIRVELLPYLRRYFNSGVDGVLLNLAEIMDAENDLLDLLTRRILRKIQLEDGKGGVTLPLKEFCPLPLAVRRRLLRTAIGKIDGSLRDLGYRHVEDSLEFLEESTPGKEIHLPRGIKIKKSYDTFCITKGEPFPRQGGSIEVPLEVPGETRVPGLGVVFQSEVLPWESFQGDFSGNFSNYQVCFDYDKIKLPLFVRTRRKGDRIRPFGLQGTKKLKKLFGELRIPPKERDRIPLVTSSRKIYWVVGYRRSDAALLSSETRQVLVLRAHKIK